MKERQDLQVNSNGKSVMLLMVDPTFSGSKGGVKVHFEMMQNWAKLEASLDIGTYEQAIKVETSNDDYRYT